MSGRTILSMVSIVLTGCSQISGLDDFGVVGGGGSVGGSVGGAVGGAGGDAGAPTVGSGGDGGTGGQANPCPNLVLELKETTTDFVEVAPSDDFDALTGFTVEAWIRVDNAVGTGEAHIVSRHNHSIQGSHLGWVLMVNGGEIEFRVYDGNWNGVRGAMVPVERWTHVAGTYDGQVVAAFVNGARTTGPMSGTPGAYDGPLRIGRAAYADAFAFLGRIDDVRVSNGVLYPGDYTVPSSALTVRTDTIALWGFQGMGVGVADSTNGHPGTLMGGERVSDACPIAVEPP